MNRVLLPTIILAISALPALAAFGQSAPATDPAAKIEEPAEATPPSVEPAAGTEPIGPPLSSGLPGPVLAPSTAPVPETAPPAATTPVVPPVAVLPPVGPPAETTPIQPQPNLPLTIPGPGATTPPATGILSPQPVSPVLPAGTSPPQLHDPAGYASSFGSGLQGSMGGNPRYIASQNVVLTWSETKDAVWGYSKSLGRWAKQTLDPPATKENEVPVVGDGVAVWQIGTTFYAFSGSAARWDVLKLPAESKARPAVDDNYVLVMDGDELHTFSVETGGWSSPQDAPATSYDASATSGTSEVRSFRLQHANAVTLEQTILRQLFADELRITANHTGMGDTIIARGKPEALDQLEALLKELDRPDQRATGSGRSPGRLPGGSGSMDSLGGYDAGDMSSGAMPDMGYGMEEGMTGMPGMPGGMSGRPASRAQLQRDLEDAERRAAELARQLRENRPQGSSGQSPAALEQAVAQAFTARQNLHRHDLAALEQRLQSTRETLTMRERIKQQIIERRVADLLNPNLQWDSPPTAAVPAPPAIARPATPMAPATEMNPALKFASDLRGTWLQVAQERNGEASLVKPGTIFTLTFDGNRYTLRQGTEKYASGTFKVGGAVGNSRELDTVRTWLKGETEETQRPHQELGLANLDQYTLQWCYGGLRANERPDQLATRKNDGRLLTEWRRFSDEPLSDEQFRSIDLEALTEPVLAPLARSPLATPVAIGEAVQIRITGLEEVTCTNRWPGSEPVTLTKTSDWSIRPENSVSLMLSNFPGRGQLQLSAQLEVPALSARASQWAELNYIPLQIASEDLDKATADGSVVMVVYLPHGAKEQAYPAMVSTRQSPGIDAVEEARKRGDVLVAVKLSKAEPAADGGGAVEKPGPAAGEAPAPLPNAGGNRSSAGDSPLILARSEEFQQRLSELHHKVAAAQRIVDQHQALAADGNPQPQRFVDNALADLRSWQNKLDLAKAEYAAQVKLLDSNLHSAEIAADAAQRSLDRTTKLFERGVTPASSLDEVRRDAQETEARVQRAKTLLDLYRRVDELSRPAAESKPDETPSPPQE